jgi:hypothetical protein
MRSLSFSFLVMALNSVSSTRPWSEQQPDQSSIRQFLKEQPRSHRQKKRSQATHGFVEEIHLLPP